MKTTIGKLVDRVLEYEWVVLVLIAYPMLFPRAEWTPVMLVIPLLWLLHWKRGKGILPKTPLNLPILVLIIMLAVSLWATFSIGFSLSKISGLLFSVAVFFATVRQGLKHFNSSVIFYLMGGFGVGVVGLLATNWSAKIPFLNNLVERFPQVIARFPGAEAGIHPNELGGILILFAPLALLLAWRSLGVRQHKFLMLGLLILAGFLSSLLVLSQSRSALLGFAIAIALLIYVAMKNKRLILLLSFIVFGALIIRFGSDFLIDETAFIETSDTAIGEITFGSRLEIWSRALYGLQDFSFTGMGMGTYRVIAPVLYPFFLISPDRDVAHAHNLFLQTGLDLGIPGLIAFMSLSIGVLISLFASTRSPSVAAPIGISSNDVALGLGAGLLGHFIYGLTDAVALGARPHFLFWMALGLSTAIYIRSAEARVNGSMGATGIWELMERRS